jgi:hypothetical protein
VKLTDEEQVDLDYLMKGGRRTHEQALFMIALGRSRFRMGRARVVSININVGSEREEWRAELVGDGLPSAAIDQLFENGDTFVLATMIGGGL